MKAFSFERWHRKLIEIQELKKVFDSGKNAVNALDGININIKSGEIYGIIGLSGAGKSTLVRCINMLEKPTAGKVIVDGEEVTSLSEKKLRLARQKIGMIFQHFNLLWSRTVAENIAFPLEIANVPKGEIHKRVAELAELVGLTDKLSAYPRQLSGGQKQQLSIARIFLKDPAILILDEATSALDNITEHYVQKSLDALAQNRTVITIAHRLSSVKNASKILVMKNGRIAEEGTHKELLSFNGVYQTLHDLQFREGKER